MRRALLALTLAGCYRGGPETPIAPGPPQNAPGHAPPRGPVNRRYPELDATLIRECTPDGAPKIVLLFENHETEPGKAPRVDWMQLDLIHAPGDPVPRTFTEGPQNARTAFFSPCFPHGCRVASVTVDELTVGGMIRGSYRLEVNGGETLADGFEAKLKGAWDVRLCPRS